MAEYLDHQRRLTANHWKIIATASIGNALNSCDFFLIGYALRLISKDWQLAYWQGTVILLAAAVGAVPGSLFWGWMADRIGRRNVLIATAITVAAATGVMALTPDTGYWIFLATCRFFVGAGVAGFYAAGVVLVQEFMPPAKRGWTSALPLLFSGAGSFLTGLLGAAPGIGWRGVFVLGLLPALVIPVILRWVPESPYWLIRTGQHSEARMSLAWARRIEPSEIALSTVIAEPTKTVWYDLFKYPRSVATVCLLGLSQAGGVGLGTWGASLFVSVGIVPPGEVGTLATSMSVAGFLGSIFGLCVIDVFGRRLWGALACSVAAMALALAGALPDVYIGALSLFVILLVVQSFFAHGSGSILAPYMAELWPVRLRGSGIGLGYGVGNLASVLLVIGFPLMMGSSNTISPTVVNLASLASAFIGFALLYVLGAVAFGLIGFETKGRSIEDISRALCARARR